MYTLVCFELTLSKRLSRVSTTIRSVSIMENVREALPVYFLSALSRDRFDRGKRREIYPTSLTFNFTVLFVPPLNFFQISQMFYDRGSRCFRYRVSHKRSSSSYLIAALFSVERAKVALLGTERL